jgi:glyoxylase-like metal-dependent hydrolase (beta-lactamase superfamily II)
MTALPDTSAAAGRRAFLAGAAAAVAAPTALAVLGAASPASASAATGCLPPGYAPVPPSALGPALNADGYFVGPITDTLYWVTDSFYQAMFLTTRDGVVLIDAPPTIGHNLLRAIEAITSANGMPSTVTHMVYSHSHADHIGASSLFGPDVIRIGQAENLRLLLRDEDPNRPPPTVTFEDRYVLEVGGELLELAYHGPNVTPDNIFVHAPAHHTLMVVDILFPGWVPFKSLAIAQDIPGWISAQQVAMSYPWTTLVGGHLGRLGIRADGLTQIQYIADLQASTRAAIASVDPTPFFHQYAPNAWAIFKAYLDAVSTQAAGPVTAKYTGVLAAADVYTFLNAAAMLDSLRVDTGDLGPFGDHP